MEKGSSPAFRALANASRPLYSSAMVCEYVIDGRRAVSLEAFFDEFERLVLDGSWGRNLDAFNDVLRGGFGTPCEGFTLRWINSAESRELLGYSETVRQLRLALARCHPTGREILERDLANAMRGVGPTVFDELVGIIARHGPGGGGRGQCSPHS